ncbi:short chain dehydrogenase [Colletotrichum sojae]|uniref:Short chain dehydrogenase n=1 Tax=Colletotrichum sojae TaxID=2175907 RepID=A0A8H6IWB4_9PEZI|nr:short chain dehydrogenase [Colletotrichum sojae]
MTYETKRIVLITGGNRGVGFETAKNLLLADADYHVIISSRDAAKGATAVKELLSTPKVQGTASSTPLDVTDIESISAAARQIESEFGRLDVLVNNAGIISMASPPTTTAFRRLLETNVIGALGVTEAFLNLLRKTARAPPRLVFVTSSMGSITHATNPASPYYTPHGTEYRASKAALNMLMGMYVARLKPEGFLVFGADPGLCATEFTGDAALLRNRGAAEPSEGGARVAAVIKGEKDVDSGKVLGVYGVCPW